MSDHRAASTRLVSSPRVTRGRLGFPSPPPPLPRRSRRPLSKPARAPVTVAARISALRLRAEVFGPWGGGPGWWAAMPCGRRRSQVVIWSGHSIVRVVSRLRLWSWRGAPPLRQILRYQVGPLLSLSRRSRSLGTLVRRLRGKRVLVELAWEPGETLAGFVRPDGCDA